MKILTLVIFWGTYHIPFHLGDDPTCWGDYVIDMMGGGLSFRIDQNQHLRTVCYCLLKTYCTRTYIYKTLFWESE